MNYENERILNEMEAEIDALNEAKTAIEKAKKTVGKVGDVCGLLHLADEADLGNLAQKYEIEIMLRERVSMAVAILTEMGIEIGSQFLFSKKSEAVFELEDMHIVLHMLPKDYSDRDYDYIIRHVIGVIAGSEGIDLPKADHIESSAGEEIKALAAFLAGQKEYEELKSETANCVDGVLSIV